MLIVIEGLDGSGKATQSDLLTKELNKAGTNVRHVSFPDYESDSSALIKMYLGGKFGDKPSDVNAYAASAFYAVDRYASFKMKWENAYQEGFVVADRYTTSNAIHQCVKLPKSQWDSYLKWLFHFEYDLLGIPAPDLVIYLRVDPNISQKLLTKRYDGDLKKKDIHEKDIEYLIHCQDAADYCAEHLAWKVVECCNEADMRGIDMIQNDIQNIIFDRFHL